MTSKKSNQGIRELGFLLLAARQEFAKHLNEKLQPNEMTSAQFSPLLAIADRRVKTAAELCRLFDYDSGAMTRLLGRIEKKGLIRRVKNEEDRRSDLLEITDAGREIYPSLIKAAIDTVDDLLEGFSEKEKKQFENYLRRIIS